MPGTETTHIAYLGLGSNLKQPAKQLRRAIEWLQRQQGIQVLNSSPWFHSAAWGVTEQPDFINAVVAIATTQPPLQLLKTIKRIEYRLMQRLPEKRWHARCIDIDILLYGKQCIHRPELKIPHPLITARCFVLHPLLFLRPDLPADLKKRVMAHLKQHDCQSALQPLKPRMSTDLINFRR